MLSKRLISALLVVNFSGGSRRPFRSAVYRIGLCYLIAIIVGKSLARAVSRADLPLGIPTGYALAIVTICGYLLSGLIALSIGATKLSQNSSFEKIVRLMPITQTSRWLAGIAPVGVVLGAVAALLVQVAVALSAGMDQPTNTICIFLFLGILSGLGLTQLTSPRSLTSKGIVFVATLILSIWIVDHSLGATTSIIREWGTSLALGLVLLPLLGFAQSYINGYDLPPNINRVELTKLLPTIIPVQLWLFVKLFRNKRVRGSFILALVMNTVIATVIVLKGQVFSEPRSILLFGAILAATFCTELRGILRRYNPPEMVLVRGLNNLNILHLTASLVLGLVIGLPVFFALNSQSNNSISFLAWFLTLQTFCSFAGLMSGVLFVPSNGEVGQQFFASILSTSILALFLKLNDLSDLSSLQQNIRLVIGSIVLVGFVFVIERIRSSSYGSA